MIKKKATLAGMVLALFAGMSMMTTAMAEPVVLKAVTAWPKKTPDNYGLFKFIEIVNKMGEGKVQIKYLGGPEVISLSQQTKAVKNGTVDISWLAAAYTGSLVPAANAFKLSTMTPHEERENGVTKIWQAAFGEQNIHFLLRGSAPSVKFHLYTNTPIDALSDFKGMPIRTSGTYQDFLSALGASPISMPPGEVYTALQRGIVQGYGWPNYGIADFGWDEMTKYMIYPGFYYVDCMGIMNKDTWDSLPDDVKEILHKAEVKTEATVSDHFTAMSKKNIEAWKENGLQIVHLDDKDAKKFVDMAYGAAWKQVIDDAPEYGPELKAKFNQ